MILRWQRFRETLVLPSPKQRRPASSMETKIRSSLWVMFLFMVFRCVAAAWALFLGVLVRRMSKAEMAMSPSVVLACTYK